MPHLLLDVVRGDRKFAFMADEATKEKALSDIRAMFEAKSPPLMIKGDRFERHTGAVVVDGDEPGLKLVDFLADTTVIRIRPEAPTEPDELDVTVSRGDTKRHHRVRPAATLAALRADLGAWMEAGDRFLTTGGAEVMDSAEATLTVGALLAGTDTLTIRAAAPTGVREITVARGDAKKLQRIDPAAMLSALRTALGAWMAGTDRFTVKGGAEVSPGDEAQISVAAALGGDDVVRITPRAASVTPGTPDVPKVPPSTPAPVKWGLSTGESPKDPLAALTQEFGKPSDTVPYRAYSELPLATKRAIFGVLQLNRALVMKRGIEASPVLEKAYEEAITVIPVTGEVQYRIPGSGMQQSTRMTTSQTVHEMRKRGVRTTRATAGAFGVALTNEYSKENESLSFREQTNTYFLSECVIAKVGYRLSAADIQVSNAFNAAVDRAVNGRSSSLQQYLDLLDVLEQFGHFVLTECTVGGKLMVEKEQLVANVQEAEQVRQTFGAAVNAEVVTPKGKFSGGAGYSQSDEEAQNHINRFALGAVTTTVWGGMPALTGTIASWVESINNPLTWAVVSYDQLTPSIAYLERPLRSRCLGLIDQHFLHEETARRTVLDMHSYVAQLREALFRAQTGI